MSAEPKVRTITVPTRQLLDSLAPLPGGMRAVLWDFESDPEGAGYADIDAVVAPYAGGNGWQQGLRRVPNLLLLQAQTTGYDGLPEVAGGAAVASAAGVHAAATAELAVGLMLASLRGIDAAVRDQQESRWNPHRYPGLADRKVTLVGVGGIGREIASRLAPFEVRLTRVGSTARNDDGGRVHGADELVRLAADTEVLVVITPLNESTRGLVGEQVLAALPDGALVVNVARGPVVDTDALTREVVSGRLRAALDVVDPEPLSAGHPLWGCANAIITPHVGGNSDAFTPRIEEFLRRQVQRLAAGGEPLNLVQSGPWKRG
ncbi:2-hydroxyacid dehydrogenase [Arthrobacter koreensis]|uniref:2-hydroxyacid dehydrogenase n=1 Tax=Arthrobacter koreensis TaxID=199136 RepID=UPI002DBBF077|nr:2-hydroxyacid dehydrogenase [Arthrobacter koreensis]MEB7448441.1 2-hydroxyacid dehydrogenase [Arthrobacter koreensis]